MKSSFGLFAVTALLGVAGARADLIWQEDFAYANGVTTNVSGGVWTRHSGTADNSFVNGGALEVQAGRADDINRALDATYSSGSLYYAFDLTLSALPTSGGSYFAHLMFDSTNFRDRLWLRTTGAGAGNFRLGISNANAFGTDWGVDLLLNTTYRVVVQADLDTDQSVLWINPTSSGSTSVTNTSASTVNATAFGIRQATGIGNMTVDNLAVGTTFNNVVPEPGTALLVLIGLGTVVAARRRFSA